jgi:hypothetical protein
MRKGLVVLLVIGGLSGGAGAAGAYTHTWDCYSYANAQKCYDPSPCCHSWIEVQVALINDPRYNVCAKAVTAAGNIRSATNAMCGVNTDLHTTCLISETPSSTAYVYWAGDYGGLAHDHGFAATPASKTPPC